MIVNKGHHTLLPTPCLFVCGGRSIVQGGVLVAVSSVMGVPSDQSLYLWLVLGWSGCRAATLAAGGVAFVGGALVSGVSWQLWPRGWLLMSGTTWWQRGGSAGVYNLPGFFQAAGSGVRGCRNLLESSVTVAPS